MAVEIERKFLVRDAPDWLAGCRAEEIEQGYLALEGDAVEVRVRRRGESLRLTVKGGAGLERAETEVELAPAQYEALWPLTDGRRISKVRHYVPTAAGEIEVDVYRGALEGLITSEIEFADRDDATAFEPPDWVAEELTGDPRYANRSLATVGLPPAGFSG